MTTPNALPPTPGRRAGSALAYHDLAARLVRLPIPREAIARLTRFVADEVETALKAARDDAFSAAEIEAAGGDELLETLRKQRDQQRTVEAIKAAGLAELSPEALQAVLDAARS